MDPMDEPIITKFEPLLPCPFYGSTAALEHTSNPGCRDIHGGESAWEPIAILAPYFVGGRPSDE